MKNNKGITLVELIVAMAIFAVVGLMSGSLLSSAVRMYRSTITYAEIQTESQTVSRRVSNAIMNAGNIYLDESEAGTFLFTGSRTESDDDTVYTGEILWFDKTQGSLYLNDSVSIKVSSGGNPLAGTEKNPLTAAIVGAALLSAADDREYLISDQVKTLEFSIFPRPEEQTEAGGNYYVSDNKISIQYSIIFQNQDDKEYEVNSSATPRNSIGELRIREDSGTGGA